MECDVTSGRVCDGRGRARNEWATVFVWAAEREVKLGERRVGKCAAIAARCVFVHVTGSMEGVLEGPVDWCNKLRKGSTHEHANRGSLSPPPRRRLVAGCSADVNRDLAQQEPLLLVDGQLAAPRAATNKGSAAIVFSGDATAVCPGRGNRLAGLGRQRVDVSCRGGSIVTLAGRSVPLRDLACSARLSASLQGPGGTCGPRGGQHVGLGYQVAGKFYNIITTCYNTDEVSTLYSEHVLHGSGIGGRQLTDGTPSFESGSLNRDFPIAQLYKQATVLRTLTKLLGSKTLADRYTSQTFIARGHLSPRADFILQAYQNATFFYVNAVPQWQSVNRGNWFHVEDAVRRHAQQHDSDLHITTGTYQVMELPNQQGRPKQVYLHDDGAIHKLPIPKFLWKVVYNPDTRSAIAFVTINNPFLGQVQNEELLCEDVCRDYGWQFNSQHKFTLGYTYCCDVNMLRQVISYIPAMKADHVLRNR